MTDEKDEKALHREAYSAAQKRLREAHPEEFAKYRKEETEARGLTWSPRLSEEEKAERLLRDLATRHPSVAAKVFGTETE